MNSTMYMFKSIPTKDSQIPQLPKCFEMEFGPQKVIRSACTFISSSLHIFVFACHKYSFTFVENQALKLRRLFFAHY